MGEAAQGWGEQSEQGRLAPAAAFPVDEGMAEGDKRGLQCSGHSLYRDEVLPAFSVQHPGEGNGRGWALYFTSPLNKSCVRLFPWLLSVHCSG